jgi:hypothetical protein
MTPFILAQKNCSHCLDLPIQVNLQEEEEVAEEVEAAAAEEGMFKCLPLFSLNYTYMFLKPVLIIACCGKIEVEAVALVEEEADEVVNAEDLVVDAEVGVEEDVVLVEEVGGVVLVEEEGNNFNHANAYAANLRGIVQVQESAHRYRGV